MSSKVTAKRWLTAKNLHQIQVLSCDVGDFTRWDTSDYCAPFWRLYWHDRRGGVIVIGGETVPIEPGKVVLIPPHTHFSSELRRPFRQLFLHFLVEPRFRRDGEKAYVFKANQETAELCGAIISELQNDTSSLRSSLLAQVLIGQALLKIPLDRWEERFEDARVTRAVARLRDQYPKRVPNTVLAREAGLHVHSFLKIFRKNTGDSPLQYLRNLRLEEACSMLHGDEATLDEIAERTGFGDRGYFTRVFTRHLHCSPARYRYLVNVSQRKRPGA